MMKVESRGIIQEKHPLLPKNSLLSQKITQAAHDHAQWSHNHYATYNNTVLDTIAKKNNQNNH